MKMKYLVVGAAIAGFAGHTVDAQPACCAAPKTVAQKSSSPAQKIRTIKLAIEGMSCGSCAASVTSALRKVDGIRNVKISFEEKGGTVEFDAATVNEAKIVVVVNRSGFKAQRFATEKS
jgi:copper chaperone CopZ